MLNSSGDSNPQKNNEKLRKEYKRIKMLPSTSSLNAATCSWSRPCPKCALLEVIRHRFRAFEVKFGRKPAPDEPLFFDPRKSHPVLASQPEIREQIRVAASASQLKVSPILRLLKLDQHSPAKEGTEACQRAFRGHPHASGLTEHRPEARHQSAWELFVRNESLHRRYGITGAELTVLSKVALMGEARNSRDFLFMLAAIRKSKQR